jgi:methylmalonyl-CoA carboxyltransferase large subunit
MNAEKLNSAGIAEALEMLRQEVARLGERVAALEGRAGTAPRATTPAQTLPAEELSEEIILVLSAAIAAYLGKKAPIRQIRLLRSDAWAQQGRTTIQASHALQPDRTRRTL